MNTPPRRSCLDDCFDRRGYNVAYGGEHASRIVGFRADDQSEIGLVQVPGFAAQQSTYLPYLHDMMHEGVPGCVVVPETAGKRGIGAIQRALGSLATGDLGDFRTQHTVVVGHSLGAHKAAQAMLKLNQQGHEGLKHLVLQAPACLGGFSWLWAGAAVAGSMLQESPYVFHPSQSRIVTEAQQYFLAHPVDIIGELTQIESDQMRHTLKQLMGEYAVHCVGIRHSHDVLINSRTSTRAMEELKIPVVAVGGGIAGHNVQLYRDMVPTYREVFEQLDLPLPYGERPAEVVPLPIQPAGLLPQAA